MNSELEEKTERLRRVMRDENLGGVLLNTQHNFSWLTCGRSNGIDLSRENGAGWIIVTANGKRCLVANNIEMPRLLNEEVSAAEFDPIEIAWQVEKDPRAVITAARSAIASGDIGCDIGFPETRWIEPSIAASRFQLTPPEIQRFRHLGSDAGKALQNVIPHLETGQTEKQIARLVRDELAGVDMFSAVTLVAADDRIARYRHPVPTQNVWKNTLLIVVCARRNGLIASLSRMICAGDVPADLQRRTEACAAVNASLYNATVEGAVSHQLYEIAERAYTEQGFGDEINKHHQGGACGYRTRDWVAHPESGDIVRPNQAFAWNPSITGTKTEETAILTNGELEIITATDGFPALGTIIDGREYFSPGILSLSKGASAE